MTKKEKKENKRRRKIFLAILMILFTGVIFTSSTYAWFTANKTVTVDKIDVKVGAQSGLQLSTNATTWKPVITNEDISGAAGNGYGDAKNQLPLATSAMIVPVSTAGAINSLGHLDMYKGDIATKDGHYILTSAKEAAEKNTTTEGHYIAFDLFFSTSDPSATLYLTSASSVKVKDGKGPKGLDNAARVAFVVQGHGAPGTEAAALQALKAPTAAEDSPNLYIWEPNYDTHTAAGVKHAKDNYGISTTETSGSKLPYIGVKDEFDSVADIPLNQQPGEGKGVHFKQHTSGANFFSTPASGIDSAAYQKLFTLKAGVTKVRVYMWIEGQDVDCENDASGADVSFDLQFSILDASK